MDLAAQNNELITGDRELAIAADQFLRSHAKVENTHNTYRRALRYFITWCNEQDINPLDITFDQALSWREYLDAKFATSTAATYGQAISAFYTLLRELDMTDSKGVRVKNWFKKLARATSKNTNKPTNASLHPDRIMEILATAQQQSMSEYIMIRLMYNAGFRREEVAELRKEMLCLNENGFFLAIEGKGDKRRDIGITDEFAYTLATFFGARVLPGRVEVEPGWAFVGKSAGTHISLRQINYIVERLAGKGVHPHMFRHSHATHAIKKGHSLSALSRTLGHANVRTTMRYVDSVNDVVMSSARIV